MSSFDYKNLANHELLRTSKAIPAGTDQAAAADHVSESLYALMQIAAAAKLEQVSIFLKYAYYEAVKARAEITGESRDDIQPQTDSCPDYAEVPEDY